MIHDETQIRKFADILLKPDNGQKMVMYLADRRKYGAERKTRQGAFERYLLTSDTDDFVSRIASYTNTNTNVCYLLCNPRSDVDSYQKAVEDIHKELKLSYSDNDRKSRTVSSLLKSSYQKTNTIKTYLELDIDTKDDEVVGKIKTFCRESIRMDIICCVETRGGYHIVFRNTLSTDDSRKLHHFRKQFEFLGEDKNGKPLYKNNFDVRRDPCVPVPGTLQAEFKVVLSSTADYLENNTQLTVLE